MRQAAQRQDEQDRGDEIGERGQGWRTSPAPHCFFLNIDSIRCVTRKPPKMFTLASVTAMKPNAVAQPDSAEPGRQHRADDDHRGDRVGHRHQRRVQRRRDVPDHVVADEAGHQEHGEQEDERARPPRRPGPAPARELMRLRRPARRRGRRACAAWSAKFDGVHAVVSGIRRPGSGWNCGCTTAPPRVSSTPLTMSSSSGSFGAFASLSQNVVRKVSRLRA